MMRNILLVAAMLLYSVTSWAGQVHYSSVPSSIDPQARYMFYMHGVAIEFGGRKAASYDYRGILRAISQRGYEVIGEERSPVAAKEYAEKVAAQVQALLKAGVPAAHITVAGHSKGGFMAMLVMSLVRDPKINYVNFAGCGLEGSGFEGGMKLAVAMAPEAQGRLLSAYDESDRISGTCKAALDKMGQAMATERVLTFGGGHELFYRAESNWLDILQNWAQGKP